MSTLSFLSDPRVQFILETLENDNHDSLVVGGAARDALRGETPKDIDVATKARPDTVESLFSQTQATLHPTGIDHGTWTVVVDELPVEITTFRRDVATDGRRATIAFADTFEEDAQRRDFTMNALGVRANGTIVDPTGQGIDDLKSGTVRFVGNAQDRCDEDALRVLRLFRFQGRMGAWPMNEDALEAARNTSLDHLSGERIWSEMKGILQTRDAVAVTSAMKETGVLSRLLPNQQWDSETLEQTVSREHSETIDPHWARRLYAATGRTRFPWPMSGKEAKHLKDIHTQKAYFGNAKIAAAAAKDEQIGIDAWTLGQSTQKNPQEKAREGANAILPIKAKDFMDAGIKPGPKLGELLEKSRQSWLANDLTLDTKSVLSALHVKKDHTR